MLVKAMCLGKNPQLSYFCVKHQARPIEYFFFDPEGNIIQRWNNFDIANGLLI